MLERLQKIISAAGVASRRAAEDIILEGRVRVNGKVVSELGSMADPGKDHIKVDGKLINPQQPQTYIMLYKPAGYITTMSDPEKRPTVQDFLKGVRTRVYPVGRLDYNTEGMLLLTNDGDFAHLITHPSHELPKTYLVKVKGQLDDATLEKLAKGIYLDDGKTAPARVRKVRREEANSWIEIAIYEGRKRQVRRMMDRVGHSVIRLKRIKIGPISLGDLPMGTYRHLTPDEVKMLRATATEDKSQKSEVRSQKSEVRSQKSGVRSQKPGVRNQKPGVRSRKPGVRSEKPGIRSEKSGVRSEKPEVRSQKPGIRSRKPGFGSQKSGEGKNRGAKKSQRPPR
jgi:23S rRNA pseudouridine2605 synthase